MEHVKLSGLASLADGQQCKADLDIMIYEVRPGILDGKGSLGCERHFARKAFEGYNIRFLSLDGKEIELVAKSYKPMSGELRVETNGKLSHLVQ